MSGSAWQWPALQVNEIPDRLKVGRAVWGKVHGAASDFRWIAASRGVNAQVLRLEKELSLGFENHPRAATCWRALPGAYCALFCYPSRALDASSRSGFLEKQLLEWDSEDHFPAALGALLLLPRVAAFDDKIWWDQGDEFQWLAADFFLELEEEPMVETGGLDERIESGRTALRARLNETSLAELYSVLLSGRRPAFLTGLEEPLPPEALAALLLPLPRRITDSLSIAGWPMSEHVDGAAFFERWNVLVCDRIPSGFRDLPERIVTEEGLLCAQALLAGDPYRLGAAPVPAPPVLHRSEPAPESRSPEILERLREFAGNEARRWFEPEKLASLSNSPLRPMDEQAGAFVDLVQKLENEISELHGAKRDHLQVKADLLRAVALTLAPSSVRKVGLPKSGRVPALLFGPELADPDGKRLVQKLSQEETLWNEVVNRSVFCKPNRYGAKIRCWLEQRGVNVEKICSGSFGRER